MLNGFASTAIHGWADGSSNRRSAEKKPPTERTYPRFLGRLELFNLVQMRLDEAHKIVADLPLRREGTVLVIDVTATHRPVEDFLHRWIIFRQEIHPVAPVFHVLGVERETTG